MPAEIPTPISHPGEDLSNSIRRRLAKVEPHALRAFTPSLAVLAKSAGPFHWTPVLRHEPCIPKVHSRATKWDPHFSR